MSKNILCFSRSYLAYLMPEFQKRDPENNYLFIVQTNEEEEVVLSKGGKVVLNIESYIKSHLKTSQPVEWQEPDDFRDITKFYFSPIYSDRYLILFKPKLRHQIAGGLMEGFKGVFRKYKVDYFLGEPVAIFSTHVLYYLTLKYGGKPRLWTSTFFPDHFFFSENVKMSTPLSLNNPYPQKRQNELKEVILTYLNGIIEDKTGPAYHHSFAKKRSVLDTFFKTRKGDSPIVVQPGIASIILQSLRFIRAKLFSFGFPWKGDFQTAASYVEHRFYLQCLLTKKSYYDDMPKKYDANNIMFPIQYEPEATLLYFSPDFSDQYAVVENILKSLPHDKTLYVKEHPNQFGALGLKKWKNLRKRFHNLRYIYGRESGRELIKKSNLITCISSSAGMDGLLLGKKVVLVGDVYYQDFIGAVKVRSFDELSLILNDINTYNYEGHSLEDNLENFMKIAEKCHSGFPYSSQTLYEENNLIKIVETIKREFI